MGIDGFPDVSRLGATTARILVPLIPYAEALKRLRCSIERKQVQANEYNLFKMLN
jgi:hypothetical protein